MSPSPSLHGERETDLLVEVYGSQQNYQQFLLNLPIDLPMKCMVSATCLFQLLTAQGVTDKS